MAEDSLGIVIEADAEEVLGRVLVVLIRDSTGEPLAGSKVYLTIEGDGAFDAPRYVQDVERVSDQDGRVMEIWHEHQRHLPRRALKSTVRARCDAPGCQVGIADIHEPGLHKYRQLFE